MGKAAMIAKKKLQAKIAECDAEIQKLVAERDKVQENINRSGAYVNQLNTGLAAQQGARQTLAELLAAEKSSDNNNKGGNPAGK